MMFRMFAAATFLALLTCVPTSAQQPAAPSGTTPAPAPHAGPTAPLYGPAINFETARRVMSAAEAEAIRSSSTVAIAIIDSGGNLMMLHRLDNTQLASIQIAQGKARTALDFRRPTKDLEDAVAAGGAGLRFLSVQGVTPIEGGIPLMLDNRIIGAIGVSGGIVGQDAQVARAGAEAVR